MSRSLDVPMLIGSVKGERLSTMKDNIPAQRRIIAGTSLFDGEAASRGYALNAMCYSFNEERNREAFRADEEGYCARFDLTPEQRAAVAARNVLAMLAGIFGLNVQDLGAQQTGLSVEEFKRKLLAQAED
jgi:protocatechuate 4,5-dioxygenase alpha chain